jgi:predicted RNase H-like HicB family nuclease
LKPRRSRDAAPRAVPAFLAPALGAGEPGAAVPCFVCPVHLLSEAEGGYSVIAPTLPGCASQGETEEEALANIIEALEGLLESYREDGAPVPWQAPGRRPRGAALRTVVVHA